MQVQTPLQQMGFWELGAEIRHTIRMQFSLSKAQKSVAGKQSSSKAELSLFPRPREESKHTLGEPGPTPEGIFDMQTTANFLKENLRKKKKYNGW